jgi:hypothetical protein
MVENPTPFWVNPSRIRPIDRIINSAIQERNPNTPQAVSDFVFGCETIFHMVQQIEPDLIILPLRGAAPIGWTLEEFEQLEGREYPKVYPRIGDHINVLSSKQRGYPRSIKQEIAKVDLSHATARVQRPLLVDEVQAGSTLTEIAHFLSSVLKDVFDCDKLYIIGAQDSRVMQRKKTDGYQKLVANVDAQFVTSTVDLPLFYVDRNELLDYLLEFEGVSPANIPTIQVMHNTEAEALFKNITFGVLHPELLLNAANGVREGDVQRDRLSQWISGLVVPGDEYYLKAENGRILDWLQELGKINLQRR